MYNSSAVHGAVIHFRDIHKLIPTRNKFLDKILQRKVEKNIAAENTLLFMTNSTFDDRPMQDSTYDKSKYKLVLFGILESGARATVQINNIEPYFEIKIPDKTANPEALAQQLYGDLFMCNDDFVRFKNTTHAARALPEFGFKIEPTRFDVCIGKPLHKFQTHNSNYVRIYFHKLSQRKDAIAYVRALGYETAHDDTGSYYRVVCRDYFLQFGTWMSLNNYTIKNSDYIKNDVINIDIGDVTPYNDVLTKHLQKDNTMSMAFDIETYNANNDGEIPLPGNAAHNVFMISMTFQWYHATQQLLSVVLVDVPCAPHPDFLTVVCDNEHNLLLGFAQIFELMQPELVMGFNSDNYDWPWIIERAQTYPGLLTQIVECFDATIVKERNDAKSLYNYKKSIIKIEATLSVDGTNLQTPGYIPFDVMTVFRKLYPVSEQYSLNYFLSKNKLGGKEDMPYLQMFKIYADMLACVKSGTVPPPELLQNMALVAKYCVVDSARCHDLTNIRNVLQDKREVANISYTSVYDAFYRADGMKVRNLVISRAQLRNIKISNIPPESAAEGKYPGAWVFPPIKGLSVSKLSIAERIAKAHTGYVPLAEWLDVTPEEILALKTHISTYGPNAVGADIANMRPCMQEMLAEHTGRPITGLDYSSLYPSLMMAYNLSPEYMITELARAKAVNKIVRDDGSKVHELYKIKFDFNGETIRGWSVRHDNHLDASKPEFKFGIFPTILKELFDARKQLKSGPLGLVHWEHERERLLALPAETFASDAIKEEYADVCFAYNALDSKQRALKVYMNTFYGESGNKRSPLYMIQVAGGITMAGRDNIKRAYNFVEARGCKTYYGDTDSIYLSMPESEFAAADIDYYTEQITKLAYWEKMVEITFNTIKPLNIAVNQHLVADNGTQFLKLAYEEVLFPVAFLAKKKYFGIPHLSKANFNVNVPLFIRGLEMKKRGVSEVLISVCDAILHTAVSVDNVLSIMEIVQNKIVEFYATDWSAPELFQAFIMTGVYKPNKQNVKMHTFKQRMSDERNIDLTPGERIKYVIAKKYPYSFDLRGRKTALSIGDKMELADKACEENIPVDIDYYMEKTINGQLARFITYHEDFQVAADADNSEEQKKAELTNLKLARKFVDNYCAKYYTNYASKGDIYKTIFKKSAALVKDKIIQACGSDKSSAVIIKLLGFSIDPEDNLEEWILNKIQNEVCKKLKNKTYGETFITALLQRGANKNAALLQLQDTYYANKTDNISKISEAQYSERQQILEIRFRQSLNIIKNTYHANNSVINVVSTHIKSVINIDNQYNDAAANVPQKELSAYLDAAALQQLETECSSIAGANLQSGTMSAGINELKFIYYNLTCNYEYIYQIRSIVEYLKDKRNKQIKYTKPMDATVRQNMIDTFVNDTLSDMQQT